MNDYNTIKDLGDIKRCVAIIEDKVNKNKEMLEKILELLDKKKSKITAKKTNK